jgi:hypothetical protein
MVNSEESLQDKLEKLGQILLVGKQKELP